MGAELLVAALAVGAGAYSSHKQAKAQKKAAAQAAEAAKNNITVQSRSAEPVAADTSMQDQSELARQNAAKRRRSVAKTVISNAQLTSSLLGNNSKLGGQ